MGFRIEYKTFSVDSIEMSHIEYVSLKNKSRKGYLDLDNHLPKVNFYKAEEDRFKGFGISAGIMIAGFLLGLIIDMDNSPFGIIVLAPIYLSFFGVFIYGLGLIFSLISYLSYSAQRQVLVNKMKKAFKESVDYEDYCRIRKIAYRPTEGGYSLNEILKG